MKKGLFKIAMIASVAFAIVSCSNESDYSDIAAIARNDAAVKIGHLEGGDGSAGDATIYSDLNPGYGYAVYFAGTFNGNWAKAYRGTYSEEKGWHLTVRTTKAFEWKALIGSYDLGEVVNAKFEGLKYLGSTAVGESNQDPRWLKKVAYGRAIYFAGNTSPTVAVRGVNLDDYTWTTETTGDNSLYDVYEGDWALGESVHARYENLTWDNGDNNVYEYDGNDSYEDGIVTRRALLISNLDNRVITTVTLNAMTNAFNEQTFDGNKFEAVENYTNLTLREISEKFKAFFENTDDDDISYVFFNAHGSSSGSIGICTDGSFRGSDVRTLLDKYVRGKVVFFAETCYAGNLIGRGLGEDSFANEFIAHFKAEESNSRAGELVDERFHVLCSSKMTETSWAWIGGIAFASECWSNGLGWNYKTESAGPLLADLDSDKKITMKELYNYSSADVDSRQTIVVYPDYDELVIGGRF